jgi:hypothetical protein
MLRGSVRQLVDHSLSPLPRPVTKLQPKKIQRRDRDSSLSGGDGNVETRDNIENIKESDENISDNGRRPWLIEVRGWQCANKISTLQRLATHLRAFRNCHRTFRMAVLLQAMIQSQLPQAPRDHCRFGN